MYYIGFAVPNALITGITGQDGSYLAELLLAKGYKVHGIIRRASSFNTGRIEHLLDRLTLHYGDVTDEGAVLRIVEKAEPAEVYNLAAQSHVRVSFDCPRYTADATAVGALNVLEAIRHTGAPIRFYQASSSEQFGKVAESPQSETTPFHPRSPYGVAKCFAHQMTVNYREAYGIHASCGILFNHESPRRGETFVTRKITKAAARISLGLQHELTLGNLDARRDWGFAGDYVEAMWLMLQQPTPDDYVIATGQTHTVREFLTAALEYAGIPRWDVGMDARYFRPSEVDLLLGNPTKARARLGWHPRVSFPELVRMMVESDFAAERKNVVH